MITTITTVTTVTIMVTLGLTAAISIVAVGSLITLLITKELASGGGSGTAIRLARFVGVGIVPLIIVFAVIVAVEIAEVIA